LVDRIESIEAFSLRVPREAKAVTGGAGSPTGLREGAFDYRWSESYPALYSVHLEAALVKVTLESGLVGWGEAQAPLAPDVACLIADQLLRPAVEGESFDGTPERVRALWSQMYSAMRVRGQTGGFMLDAIAAVDMALWDLAGKMRGRPVCALLADEPTDVVPAYWSGLVGADNAERVEQAAEAWSAGFRTFKLFHDRGEDELFDLIDRLRERLGAEARIAVDALWRLDGSNAAAFGEALDRRDALWLEAPLPPELVDEHEALAKEIRTPLALGESYRTRYELRPFLERGAVGWLQPDLGRCGLTEACEWDRAATTAGLRTVPHISIAMAPQIAAALHFAAAAPSCGLAEYNPKVFTVANRFLREPLALKGAAYRVPTGPGLGVEIDEQAVRRAAQRPVVQAVSQPIRDC